MLAGNFFPSFQASFVEGDDKSEESSAPTLEENINSNAEILFNPNVFTEYKLAGSPEVSLQNYSLLSLYQFDDILLFSIIRKLLQMKSW